MTSAELAPISADRTALALLAAYVVVATGDDFKPGGHLNLARTGHFYVALIGCVRGAELM